MDDNLTQVGVIQSVCPSVRPSVCLFECLQDRQLIRNICRPGHKPNYGEMDDNLTQVGVIQSVCLSVRPSVRPSVCLSVCLSLCLGDRQLIRNICRPGHKPNYGEMDDNLTQVSVWFVCPSVCSQKNATLY